MGSITCSRALEGPRCYWGRRELDVLFRVGHGNASVLCGARRLRRLFSATKNEQRYFLRIVVVRVG